MARLEFESQAPRFDVIQEAMITGQPVKLTESESKNLRVGSAVNDEFCALPNVSMPPGAAAFVNSNKNLFLGLSSPKGVIGDPVPENNTGSGLDWIPADSMRE